MNRQIQILTKDLAKAHEKLAAQPTAAPVTTALAVPPSQAVAAAQHPPASLAPPQMAHPAASPLGSCVHDPDSKQKNIHKKNVIELQERYCAQKKAYLITHLWYEFHICRYHSIGFRAN